MTLFSSWIRCLKVWAHQGLSVEPWICVLSFYSCVPCSVSWLYYIIIIIVYIVSSFWEFWPWDYVYILFECFQFFLPKGWGPTSSSMPVRNIKMSWFVFLQGSCHFHFTNTSSPSETRIQPRIDVPLTVGLMMWLPFLQNSEKALFSKGTVYS